MKMNIYINYILVIALFCCFLSCNDTSPDNSKKTTDHVGSDIVLNRSQAENLAKLPLKCIQHPLPYKAGHTIAKEEDLAMPQVHHPAFYGCFDWHSSVHGHWSLVYLIKTFPDLKDQDSIRKMLNENLTEKNIKKELAYFSLNKYTKSFERTYGWAWLLKLSEELYTWDDPDGRKWHQNLQPLAQHISEQYQEYLPKLVYPIRVGEHSNTAFGLGFAYDYALTEKDKALQTIIEQRARDFYQTDADCPLSWEPSGYDFLSPCLEEINIMRRILSPTEFPKWIEQFLGKNYTNMSLVPAEIKDRTDGKLVHLDGLNFSRAWCLYPIASFDKSFERIANKHLAFSIANIVDGDYSGEHWLASFALYALKTKKEYAQ